ncbi:MAG: hypothetical protein ACN6PN_15560, partial [Sphingobacterium sp.]
MNTTNYSTSATLLKAILAFFLLLTLFFLSCKEDNELNSFLTLKDGPSKMEVVANGSSETFTVQSNGNWKVEPLRKESWFKIDVTEGS